MPVNIIFATKFDYISEQEKKTFSFPLEDIFLAEKSPQRIQICLNSNGAKLSNCMHGKIERYVNKLFNLRRCLHLLRSTLNDSIYFELCKLSAVFVQFVESSCCEKTCIITPGKCG